MIIDHTYFTQKLSLPQRGNTEGQTQIDDFVETYEEEYLKKVLGYDLWKAFDTGIAGSPGGYDQRWIDLLDGKEFTYQGRMQRWEGFSVIAKTPIANYVYYKWMEDTAEHNTLVGTAVQNVDNNSRVNAVSKMVDAWNRMVDMNRTLWMFLKSSDTYPEWTDPDESYWSWWQESNWDSNPNEVFVKRNSLDL